MDYKKILREAKAGEHLKKFGLKREPFYITNDVRDFVGRTDEQKKLIRYLVNMSQGLSHTIIILGNHGVGKTAFIEQIYPSIDEVKKEIGYDKMFYISGLADFKKEFLPAESSDILLDARRSPKKTLLFVDDLDVIYEKYIQIIPEILDPEKFDIVGTWNTSSWKRINYDGRSFKIPKAEILHLENLGEDECIEIIKRRLNNSASDSQKARGIFPSSIIKLLNSHARGNPFILITYAKRLFDFLINKNHDSCDEKIFEEFVQDDLLGRRFNPDKITKLSPRENEIFNFLIQNVEVTADDLSKEMHFSRVAAVKYLRKLAVEGLLHYKQKGRNVYYYVPIEVIYTPKGEVSTT